VLRDTELTALGGSQLRKVRTQLQMVFQDPVSSLNPRWRVRDIIAEGLKIWGNHDAASLAATVAEILEAVGLDPSVADRRPNELSGGQCQRVCIARALVLEPAVIVCDEPVSALDVSVQAQIVNLLAEMKERYGLTLLFIAHDLAVVRQVSDRVVVMYLGKVCEIGGTDSLYEQPAHPYTRILLGSVPQLRTDAPETPELIGELPSPVDPPSGCRFRTRCPRADERCAAEEPIVREIGPDHFVACHHPHLGEATTDATAAGPADTPTTDARPMDEGASEPGRDALATEAEG
jgi:peptide/nickel transport system ATP-binding protein